MASSRARAAGSEKASARIAARSSAPPGGTSPTPKASRSAGSAAPPAAVSSREISSASITVAPRPARNPAAVDFPEPIPPVSPMARVTPGIAPGTR